MFTDRYISLPIILVDKNHQDMGIRADTEDGVMKVNPFDISRYYKTYDNNRPVTMVVFKCGDTQFFNLTVSEFEQRLNDFVTQ